MKAPQRIYLQIGENVECGMSGQTFADVSWCEDRINNSDVEYIRGDVSEQFAKAAAFYARKSDKGEQPMPAWAKPIVEALRDLGYALSPVGAPDDEMRNTALELKWACVRALSDAADTNQDSE